MKHYCKSGRPRDNRIADDGAHCAPRIILALKAAENTRKPTFRNHVDGRSDPIIPLLQMPAMSQSFQKQGEHAKIVYRQPRFEISSTDQRDADIRKDETPA